MAGSNALAPIAKFKKPNVRALFKPDPGWLLVDADLSGADAQVVFAEGNEWDTVERLAKDVKLHVETATEFFGERFVAGGGDVKDKHTAKGRMYADCKLGAHLTNYGGSARTMAASLNWTQKEAERFQQMWFRLHPGLRAWQQRVELEMREHRITSNRFGYRIHWFDRLDGLLPEALAWGPQSCVGITTFRAAAQIRKMFPFVQFLIQVHDSLVFQLPKSEVGALPEIALALEVPIPYEEHGRELVIPWKLAVSESSWGEAKAWPEKGGSA